MLDNSLTKAFLTCCSSDLTKKTSSRKDSRGSLTKVRKRIVDWIVEISRVLFPLSIGREKAKGLNSFNCVRNNPRNLFNNRRNRDYSFPLGDEGEGTEKNRLVNLRRRPGCSHKFRSDRRTKHDVKDSRGFKWSISRSHPLTKKMSIVHPPGLIEGSCFTKGSRKDRMSTSDDYWGVEGAVKILSICYNVPDKGISSTNCGRVLSNTPTCSEKLMEFILDLRVSTLNPSFLYKPSKVITLTK